MPPGAAADDGGASSISDAPSGAVAAASSAAASAASCAAASFAALRRAAAAFAAAERTGSGVRFAPELVDFFAVDGRFAAVERAGADGSAIESGASDEAAAERFRLLDGVDERDAEEDDVERAPVVDRAVAVLLFAAGFDGAPSSGADSAACSEGIDGMAPSSF